MSKSSLAVTLSKLSVFQNPQAKSEQYATDSEVAADFLWTAYMQGDIKDKTVADLGAGTGILGIGAFLLGAKKVYFVEEDATALVILRQNLASVEVASALGKSPKAAITKATLIMGDIRQFTILVDTVIMNPPFGTRNKGADSAFLTQACTIAPRIYSMHKSSTLDFIRKQIKNLGYELFSQKSVNMPLKASMKHHTKTREYIDIVCIGLRKHL